MPRGRRVITVKWKSWRVCVGACTHTHTHRGFCQTRPVDVRADESCFEATLSVRPGGKAPPPLTSFYTSLLFSFVSLFISLPLRPSLCPPHPSLLPLLSNPPRTISPETSDLFSLCSLAAVSFLTVSSLTFSSIHISGHWSTLMWAVNRRRRRTERWVDEIMYRNVVQTVTKYFRQTPNEKRGSFSFFSAVAPRCTLAKCGAEGFRCASWGVFWRIFLEPEHMVPLRRATHVRLSSPCSRHIRRSCKVATMERKFKVSSWVKLSLPLSQSRLHKVRSYQEEETETRLRQLEFETNRKPKKKCCIWWGAFPIIANYSNYRNDSFLI